MTASDRSVRLVLAGWATFVLMALLVILVRGEDHLANMTVFIVIAIAMGVWVARRRRRAAITTSLVLGVLHTVQQVAYLTAGLTATDLDAAEVAVDAVGLASGCLLVAGAIPAVARRRREPVEASR